MFRVREILNGNMRVLQVSLNQKKNIILHLSQFFFKINKCLLPLIKLVSLIRTLCEVYFDRICWVKFVFTCVIPAVLTVTSTNKTKIFLKVSFNTNKLHMALYCSPMTSISMNLTKINYFIAY